MKKYVPYLTFLKIFLLFLTVVNDGACRAWTKRDARTPFRCGDEKIEGSKCHWNFWWPNCKSLKQIDQTMCWPTIGQLFSTNRHTPFAVTTHSIKCIQPKCIRSICFGDTFGQQKTCSTWSLPKKYEIRAEWRKKVSRGTKQTLHSVTRLEIKRRQCVNLSSVSDEKLMRHDRRYFNHCLPAMDRPEDLEAEKLSAGSSEAAGRWQCTVHERPWRGQEHHSRHLGTGWPPATNIRLIMSGRFYSKSRLH